MVVGDLDAPGLDDDDAHHLRRVLRLRPGEMVGATHGRGGWRLCAYDGRRLEPAGEVQREPRPQPPITVASALTKGDRPEWVVQKLTEAGVDRIVPLSTERCVIRWDGDRAGRHHERLAAVARAALMQSRGVWLPEVAPLTSLVELLDSAGPAAALADPDGVPPSLDRPVVVVGPEGGFSPAERDAAPATVTLGPTVLRSETAAVAAGVLLGALRAGIVTTRVDPDAPRSG